MSFLSGHQLIPDFHPSASYQLFPLISASETTALQLISVFANTAQEPANEPKRVVSNPVLLKSYASTQTKAQSSTQPPMRLYMNRISKTSNKTNARTVYRKNVDILMQREPLWNNIRQGGHTLFWYDVVKYADEKRVSISALQTSWKRQRSRDTNCIRSQFIEKTIFCN